MNPFGVHFSSMTVSKLVLVTPDGYVHPTLGAQLPINVSPRLMACKTDIQMAGFYIHSAIHHARPEVEAAAHCQCVKVVPELQ